MLYVTNCIYHNVIEYTGLVFCVFLEEDILTYFMKE